MVVSNPSDVLNEASLKEALKHHPFRFYSRVNSTMDMAREWLHTEPGLPSYAVVIADEQVAGRGRLNRQWHTPAGQALAMSIILRPRLVPEHLQRVTMAAGVAVAETLNPLLIPGVIKLKWPNDVQLAGRKVAGILTEALWLGDQLQAVIVGVGINVRVNFMGTPLADGAVSLEAFTQEAVSRATLAAEIIAHLENWVDKISEPVLLDTWRTWLSTIGQTVHIHTTGGIISGIAENVDAMGALLVRDSHDGVQRILVGDVTPAQL
ncbi:MAG: biotin--[acetyl-CoA-carboxylase] ligase [Chloroflexi bacterium]|nr:biotin--[acetyl-CoA-carboxylase] ligase [Chloroflexota bacterium]NOG62277.1 biotin--[acetyl-CoA-carboxylase] ligase [Chloroflexota bacterium]